MFRYVAAVFVLLAAAFIAYLVLTLGDLLYTATASKVGGNQVLDTALQVVSWALFAYVVSYAAAVVIYKRRR